MKNRRRTSVIWIILSCLAVCFGFISLKINDLMTQQNDIISDLSNVEYLSSSSQRLTRMLVTDFLDDKVTFYIDNQTMKFLSDESDIKLSVLKNPDTRDIADTIIDNWHSLLELFELPEYDPEELEEGEEPPTYDIDAIVLAADNHFNSMTNLSMNISEQATELSQRIEELQRSSYMILLLITFFIISHLANTSVDMATSRELAAISSIDISTRLYNRSKCQELFHDMPVEGRELQPAVVVIDLNDLKKTNDLQGHRVGDDLICTFADILRNAVNVHERKPFMGRYGGDEFVIFYKDVPNEDEIKTFVKELAFLTEEVNNGAHKPFRVSYALGYAINMYGKDGLNTQQLFDEADENMYANKKDMKAKLQEVTQTV